MLLDVGPDRLDVHQLGGGAGAPLVMVCATAQPWVLWEPLARAFARHVPVIGYDHPGLGVSEAGERPVTLSGLVEDAVAILDALDVPSADLLGWSLGSAICQELAAAHPDRVSSLTLWGAWARTDAYQRALFAAMRHPWTTGDLKTAVALLGLVFSPEALDDAAFADRMGALLPALPDTTEAVDAVIAQWDADLAHNATARLGQIAAPTLVVAGERDIVTPPRHAHAVADAIPGARIEVLSGPGSSHALGLERAEEFVPLVLGFLRDSATAGGRRNTAVAST